MTRRCCQLQNNITLFYFTHSDVKYCTCESAQNMGSVGSNRLSERSVVRTPHVTAASCTNILTRDVIKTMESETKTREAETKTKTKTSKKWS